MCQLKVSSPTGRSQSEFDVYYFEIRHRRKQSRGAFTCVYVPVQVSLCVCIMKNVYVFNAFIVLCKSAICLCVCVCVCWVFPYIRERERPQSPPKPAENDPPLPKLLTAGVSVGRGKYEGEFLTMRNKWANTGTQLGGSHGYVSSLDEQHDGLFTPGGGKALPQEMAH